MTCLASSFRDTKSTRNGGGGAKEVQNLMLRTFVSALHAFFPKAILRNNTMIPVRQAN